jgi:FKBP-type peptidyl-prolyl cis-trans isomerase FkpA
VIARVLPPVLLAGLVLASCSGFDLGPEPATIPTFDEVDFAESLDIDRDEFTATSGIWVRDDGPEGEDPGEEDPGEEDPDEPDPGEDEPDEEEPAEPASTGDVVRFWYEGWVSDGTPFDARRPDAGEPAALRLGVPGPMPGLSTALTGMRAGDHRTAIIPPNLGFGPAGADPVPPNAWLVLRIEMVEVIPPEES